jgi:hypothetical protein
MLNCVESEDESFIGGSFNLSPVVDQTASYRLGQLCGEKEHCTPKANCDFLNCVNINYARLRWDMLQSLAMH